LNTTNFTIGWEAEMLLKKIELMSLLRNEEHFCSFES